MLHRVKSTSTSFPKRKTLPWKKRHRACFNTASATMPAILHTHHVQQISPSTNTPHAIFHKDLRENFWKRSHVDNAFSTSLIFRPSPSHRHRSPSTRRFHTDPLPAVAFVGKSVNLPDRFAVHQTAELHPEIQPVPSAEF